MDRKRSRIISFFHSLSVIAWFLTLVCLACTNSCHHPAAAASSTVFLSFIFPLTGDMALTFQTNLSVCPPLHLSVYCNTFTPNFTTNAIFKSNFMPRSMPVRHLSFPPPPVLS